MCSYPTRQLANPPSRYAEDDKDAVRAQASSSAAGVQLPDSAMLLSAQVGHPPPPTPKPSTGTLHVMPDRSHGRAIAPHCSRAPLLSRPTALAQRMMDEAILRMHSSSTGSPPSASLEVRLKIFPRVEAVERTSLSGMYGSLFVVMALTLPTLASVVRLVSEKESHVAGAMRSLGVSSAAYWIVTSPRSRAPWALSGHSPDCRSRAFPQHSAMRLTSSPHVHLTRAFGVVRVRVRHPLCCRPRDAGRS